MSLWPGIIVFVFGAGWFGIRRFETHQDRRFVRTGVRVPGEVVELVTYPNEDDLQTGQYRLILHYSYEDRKYRMKSRHGSSTWSQEIGKKYTVLIDPKDPENARLEIDVRIGQSSWGYLLIAAIGALMILAEFFADGVE